MKIYELMTLSKDEVLNFIRKRLAFDNKLLQQLHCYNESKHLNWKGNPEIEHKRFDMTGYYGSTPNNMDILNSFNDIGIYDGFEYLFINFHKGTPYIHWQYLNDTVNHNSDLEGIDLCGESTSNIVYKIFEIILKKN